MLLFYNQSTNGTIRFWRLTAKSVQVEYVICCRGRVLSHWFVYKSRRHRLWTARAPSILRWSDSNDECMNHGWHVRWDTKESAGIIRWWMVMVRPSNPWYDIRPIRNGPIGEPCRFWQEGPNCKTHITNICQPKLSPCTAKSCQDHLIWSQACQALRWVELLARADFETAWSKWMPWCKIFEEICWNPPIHHHFPIVNGHNRRYTHFQVHLSESPRFSCCFYAIVKGDDSPVQGFAIFPLPNRQRLELLP